MWSGDALGGGFGSHYLYFPAPGSCSDWLCLAATSRLGLLRRERSRCGRCRVLVDDLVATARNRSDAGANRNSASRSEEHTPELQPLRHLVCRLLLEKKTSLPAKRSPSHPRRPCHISAAPWRGR